MSNICSAKQISNRFFHYMWNQQGLRPNDMAAMLFQNCPEFLFTQVGFAKLKVAQSWMNYNLRGKSFLGTLDIADPKLLIFETAMAGHVLETLDDFLQRPKPIKLVLWDNENGGDKLVAEFKRRGAHVDVITAQSLMAFSDAEPDPAIRREGTQKEETMCLICENQETRKRERDSRLLLVEISR